MRRLRVLGLFSLAVFALGASASWGAELATVARKPASPACKKAIADDKRFEIWEGRSKRCEAIAEEFRKKRGTGQRKVPPRKRRTAPQRLPLHCALCNRFAAW